MMDELTNYIGRSAVHHIIPLTANCLGLMQGLGSTIIKDYTNLNWYGQRIAERFYILFFCTLFQLTMDINLPVQDQYPIGLTLIA